MDTQAWLPCTYWPSQKVATVNVGFRKLQSDQNSRLAPQEDSRVHHGLPAQLPERKKKTVTYAATLRAEINFYCRSKE